MGLGLGAEIVIGYSTMTEFVPPRTRGRWLAFMSFIVVFGLPATAVLGYLIIPNYGWRPMFVICGLGSLVVWYLRKSLPESPRWLETQGRTAEAEALMQAIEKEAATAAPLPPPKPAAPIPSFSVRLAFEAVIAAQHGCRLGSADHDQHADLRFRAMVADLLRARRPEHHQIVRLHARDHHGVANRLRYRGFRLRLLRSQALAHCRSSRYDRPWGDLSIHARGDRAPHSRFPVGRGDLDPRDNPVWSLHTGAVSDRGATSRQWHLQCHRAGGDDRLAIYCARVVPQLRRHGRAGADDRAAHRPHHRPGGVGDRARQSRLGGTRNGYRQVGARPPVMGLSRWPS